MSTDRDRLLDMIEHLDLIERYRPESEAALEADEVVAAAMVRWIEIVGEAASHVSEQVRNQSPDVPWRAIIAMRNRLIHAYPQVSLPLVWGVIDRAGPALRERLQTLVEDES